MIPPTPTDTTSTSPRRDSRAENPSQSHENRAETDAMSEDATHATIHWLRSFCLRHRWTTLIAVTALVVSIPNWRIGLMAMSDWPIAKVIAQVAIVVATTMFAVAPLPASVDHRHPGPPATGARDPTPSRTTTPSRCGR